MGHFPKMLFAAALAASLPAANAQSVNFNLTGTITPGTCTVTIPDTNLGTWAASSFTGVGSTPTTQVNVPITISACAALVTTVHVRISGTADVANAALFRGLAGIGIDLRSATDASIRPDGTVSIDAAVTGGAASHVMRARFQQSAVTMSYGSVSSALVAAITYN